MMRAGGTVGCRRPKEEGRAVNQKVSRDQSPPGNSFECRVFNLKQEGSGVWAGKPVLRDFFIQQIHLTAWQGCQ